jgi:uncharacterized repeat protein (TIGR03843 family)
MTPAALLAQGTIEVVGRIRSSSNQALLVTVVTDDDTREAIYKAEAGERPLWDFPEGLWRREVAASVLDELLGFDLVPPTVGRSDGPFGPGSLQLWVADNGVDHYFTLRERPALQAWFQRLSIFDVLANNTDRKSGHVLFDDTRCWAIDHGVCFHVEPKLRTVIWEFAGLPIPDELTRALAALTDERLDGLRGWLEDDEVAAVGARRDDLLRAGFFPIPDETNDYPPYPWPLI